MNWTSFFWIGIVAAVVVILFIVVKKFSQLTAIDIAAIPKEREAQKKNEIIAARIARQMRERFAASADRVAPFFGSVKKRFHAFYEKISVAEHQYQRRIFSSPEERRRRIEVLMNEALTLRDTKQFFEAEKRYVEVVRLDPHSIPAYHALGDLYLDAKDYEQARETFAFLLAHHDKEFARLTSRQRGRTMSENQSEETNALRVELAKDANALGCCCIMLEDYEAGIEAYERAVAMEPSNPKYLDFLLDACILGGNRRKAWAVFNTLQHANPENQKLDELRGRLQRMG